MQLKVFIFWIIRHFQWFNECIPTSLPIILGLRWEQHGGELKRFAFGVAAAVTSAALPGIGSWGLGVIGERMLRLLSRWLTPTVTDWRSWAPDWVSGWLKRPWILITSNCLLYFLFIFYFILSSVCEAKTKDFFIEGTHRVCNKK